MLQGGVAAICVPVVPYELPHVSQLSGHTDIAAPAPTALEQSLFEFWDDMPVYGK